MLRIAKEASLGILLESFTIFNVISFNDEIIASYSLSAFFGFISNIFLTFAVI